jgi:GDP-L-fucose synthase
LKRSKITGHQGEIIWDATKPDGTARKLMDISRMHALGWKHQVQLEEGTKNIRLVLENIDHLREVKM